jgi:flavin-dependent dehydrogenase
VPSGLTNVCVVVPRREQFVPRAVLETAVAADPQLRERFAGARMMSVPSVVGPLAVDAATAGVQGLLLAGDAAGFIDPMTGDGLRFAVRGGELAAEAALAAFAGQSLAPHLHLARARRREFVAKWRFNRALRRIVDRAVTVELAGAVAAAAPWMLRRTIGFAGDVPRS